MTRNRRSRISLLRTAVATAMSLLVLTLSSNRPATVTVRAEGGAQSSKDRVREQVYAVYLPPRAQNPDGTRVGRLEGQRLAVGDRTITRDERFKLEFVSQVSDLNSGIIVGEFDPLADADGRHFVMWGTLAAGTLRVSQWIPLNEPGIRITRKVQVSRTRSDQIILRVVKPDDVLPSVSTYLLFGNSLIDQAAQAMRRPGTTAADEIEAEVLGVFAAEQGHASGTAFVERWRLTPPGAETALIGRRLTYQDRFVFRTPQYSDNRPELPPFRSESKQFSASAGPLEVRLKNVSRAVIYGVPTPYRVELVQVNGQGSRVVASHETSGEFHFRYEISASDARDSTWQVTLEAARDEAQQWAGEFECDIPYDYAPAPYIIAYVDYLDILDKRGQVAEGDGEFTFVFAAATGTGDQRREFAVRFPAQHHLDVPGPVTYEASEIQVPFFARREADMGPSLGIALTGRESDDTVAADVLKHLHQSAGNFWDVYTQNQNASFSEQAKIDAKAWLNILGWTGSKTIGPHLRNAFSDERYGMDFQEPLEFDNAGVGPTNEKIHYTIKRVDAWQLTGLKITLNSITVPRQHTHNGRDIPWDEYQVFATARAADGFYTGGMEAAKRLPKDQDRYLVEDDPGRDRAIPVDKVIFERWGRREVPFVYVELVLYDDDALDFDQLVMKHRGPKSAIYSRLFLMEELLIDGQAAGSRRIQETRGGVTLDYTISWTR